MSTHISSSSKLLGDVGLVPISRLIQRGNSKGTSFHQANNTGTAPIDRAVTRSGNRDSLSSFGRGGPHLNQRVDALADLLHDAAETHHVVYKIVDGNDLDWASWYADWLINLSALPTILGRPPVRSELVWKLVDLDKAYTAQSPEENWEPWYAERLLEHFSSET